MCVATPDVLLLVLDNNADPFLNFAQFKTSWPLLIFFYLWDFSLPDLNLVSANDSPEVVCKGLKNGAQRFLVKPVSPNDVENLWQYSEWWMKNKKDSTAPVSGIKRSYESYATAADHDDVNSKRTCVGNGASAIVTKSISAAYVASTIVATRTAEIKPEGAEIEPEKRSNKLIWSRKLHARFVEAMLVIGYERAVPTNILDVMNVPGLTRDQVGSHLQKYQNFLKRVLAGKTSLDCSHWVDVNYYSPIVSGNPDKLLVTKLCDEKRGVCVRPRKVLAAQSDLSSCRQLKRLPLFKLAEGSSMSKTNSVVGDKCLITDGGSGSSSDEDENHGDGDQVRCYKRRKISKSAQEDN